MGSDAIRDTLDGIRRDTRRVVWDQMREMGSDAIRDTLCGIRRYTRHVAWDQTRYETRRMGSDPIRDTSLCACLSVRLSVYLRDDLSAYLCLSVCPSVRRTVRLSDPAEIEHTAQRSESRCRVRDSGISYQFRA